MWAGFCEDTAITCQNMQNTNELRLAGVLVI